MTCLFNPACEATLYVLASLQNCAQSTGQAANLPPGDGRTRPAQASGHVAAGAELVADLRLCQAALSGIAPQGACHPAAAEVLRDRLQSILGGRGAFW